MSANKALDFRAYQNARNVINQVTNSRMSKSQKLEACFRWVMSKYYFYMETFRSGWSGMVRSTGKRSFLNAAVVTVSQMHPLSHTLQKPSATKMFISVQMV